MPRTSSRSRTRSLCTFCEVDARIGSVVCFFQPAQKFKSRFATLGFSDKANLEDGAMWPTYFALTDLTTADEVRIAALVKKAVS